MCSINIGQLQVLVKAFEHASVQLPSDKSRADSLLTDASLATDATSGVSAIATWISDELRPTRRRLALAQQIAASSPGSGLVSFDESLVSTASAAQVRARVGEATKLLKAGDPKSLAQLTKLLQDNGLDPYFASAFAKATSPEDYEKFIKVIGPTGGYQDEKGKLADCRYPDGVTAQDYQTFVSVLGGTLGAATRATGSLALPSSWSKRYVQMMVNPFEGPDGHKYDDDPGRQSQLWYGRCALSLLMSRGSFSTPFLKLATTQISKVADGDEYRTPRHYLPDGTPMPAIPVDKSGAFPVIGANGVVFEDPVLALMGALAQNGEAAKWAFTQGGTTDFPLPMDGDGKSVPVNSFMARILTKHQWPDSKAMQSVMFAVRAGAEFDPSSSVGTSINNFIKSEKQQKEKWDKTPWYEKWGHQILDGLSLLALAIPIPGVDMAVSAGLQAANAAWYAAEGDLGDAGLSVAGAFLSGVGALGAFRGGAAAMDAVETAGVVDKFGNLIPEDTAAFKALQAGKELEPGVFGFTDPAQMKAALAAKQPDVAYQMGDLKYFTDAEGNLSKVQIYSGGKWIDGPGSEAAGSFAAAQQDDALALAQKFDASGMEPGTTGRFWHEYLGVDQKRRTLIAGMKAEDQQALAKSVEKGNVQLDHGNENSIWGAIGEQRGFEEHLADGETPIIRPGHVNAKGVDYAFLQKSEDGDSKIMIYDAKYYKANTKLPEFPKGAAQEQRFIAQVRSVIQDYDGPDAQLLKKLAQDDKNFEFKLDEYRR